MQTSSLFKTTPAKISHFLVLLVLISLIFIMGLVMIYNTFSAELLDTDSLQNPLQTLWKQLIFFFIGCMTGLSAWWIGYRSLLRWSIPLVGMICVALLLVYIPGIGQQVNGARRWIRLGSISFQPSEFMKYFLPLSYIYLTLTRPWLFKTWLSFYRLLALYSFIILLVLFEPDIATAGLLGLSLLVLFFLTAVPGRYWVWPIVLLATMGGLAVYHLPYARSRIDVYIHPEKDLQGKGHQPYQAKIAAGAGQLWGRGLGKSLQKLNYLPEAQNDYIAAIYAEEFGFVGILVLICTYSLIMLLGYWISIAAEDQAGCYVAMLITFLIGFQAFLNLGVVSGLLPSKGLNLPFFSQGGTNLVANMMGIGILGSVAIVRKKPYPDYEYLQLR
jgi:cell division protein FtsW